jgi:hypothetical protein
MLSVPLIIEKLYRGRVEPELARHRLERTDPNVPVEFEGSVVASSIVAGPGRVEPTVPRKSQPASRGGWRSVAEAAVSDYFLIGAVSSTSERFSTCTHSAAPARSALAMLARTASASPSLKSIDPL